MTSLDGKTVVVTGASAGVGAAGARRLSELGATVAVVGRSPEKTAAVAEEIGAESYTVDFGRLADVRALAEMLLDRYPVIDILANNAGGLTTDRTITEDGHEWMFQVNYLAPFLLTNLLLGRLGKSEDARVISTSSAAHRFGKIDLDDLSNTGGRFGVQRSYAASKLGNVLFTLELARRDTAVTASAFHPGPIRSDFFRGGGLLSAAVGSPLSKLVMITPERGAAPLVHLATTPDDVNGAYFDKMKRVKPKGRQVSDREFARALWDRTADVVGL
jgi:NAD(P)-dependent dehydrogenase (short-subunit alcohol dehydrogenase family)